MKFCQDHWNELKAEIDRLGLGHLVAGSGQEAASRMVRQLETRQAAGQSYDPLMHAHNAIVSNALDAVGLEVMQDNQDGTDRCPVCWLVQTCQCGRGDACDFKTWIELAARDAYTHAKSSGLLATT